MPKVIASAPNAGGRHQRGRRVGPTLAEINIIPLVDVMLVLLIIFMVAAPMLQRGVEVNLPSRAPVAGDLERADVRRRADVASARTARVPRQGSRSACRRSPSACAS